MPLTSYLANEIRRRLALILIGEGDAYESEGLINPCYCTIDDESPFRPNEKKIWVLRHDLTVATGIKNVGQSERGRNTTFQSQLAKDLVDKGVVFRPVNDRYGHPSIAFTDKIDDARAYYAGWLSQRDDHIQVYLWSGRFNRHDLSPVKQILVELYITTQLMKLGNSPVYFHDAESNRAVRRERLEQFLNDQPFPDDAPRRVYTVELLNRLNRLPEDSLHDGTILGYYFDEQLHNNNTREVSKVLEWVLQIQSPQAEDSPLLEYLLNAVNKIGQGYYSTLLIAAIKNNDLMVIDRILNNRHLLSQQDINIALIEAVRSRHNTMVLMKLINLGADVNYSQPDGWTPLHHATMSGNKFSCKILLRLGAKRDAVNSEGKMPVDLAQSSGMRDLVQVQTELSCECSCFGFFSQPKPKPASESAVEPPKLQGRQ